MYPNTFPLSPPPPFQQLKWTLGHSKSIYHVIGLLQVTWFMCQPYFLAEIAHRYLLDRNPDTCTM